MAEISEPFTWAKISLMGHTVLWGRASSEDRYGTTGIRIDVPGTATRDAEVHWYAPGALFGVLETDETTVLKHIEDPWSPPNREAIRAFADVDLTDDWGGEDEVDDDD